MRFTNIRDHLNEARLAQPAGRKLAENSTRAHVQPEIERGVVRRFALDAAFSRYDEKEAQFAEACDSNEGDESAMRIALRQAM
jgi:hypothetical protein